MTAAAFDTAVVVLGMHRSGTSTLSRMLGLCGYVQPCSLSQAENGDAQGFGEAPQISAFNNGVFTSLGLAWHTSAEVPKAWVNSPQFDACRAALRGLLREEFPATRRPLIMDPRICRFADLWLSGLAEASERTVVVTVVRNPADVARSLASSGDFGFGQSQLLWARHYLDAEYLTRSRQRCFVAYADLLADWRAALGRLESALDLPLAGDHRDDAALEACLSTDMREHQAAEPQVLDDSGADLLVAEIYAVLLRWSQGGVERVEDHVWLDQARQTLNQMTLPGSFVDLTGEVPDTTFGILPQVHGQVADDRLPLLPDEDDGDERLTGQFAILARDIHRNRALEFQLAAERAAAIRERNAARETSAQLRRDLAASQASLADLGTELKVVKRKYRRAQADVLRERQQHDVTVRRLEDMQAQVTRYRAVLPLRLYRATIDFGRRLGNLRLPFASNPERHRQRHWAAVIERSPLFQRDWYLRTYPDVADARIDPLDHFVRLGWREGRDPGPEFDTSAYLKANPDVAVIGMNPLVHYLEFGESEGRSVKAKRQSASGLSSARQGSVPLLDARLFEPFGAAAPVFRASVGDEAPLRWRRHYRLAQGGLPVLTVGEIPAAVGADDLAKTQLAVVVERFRQLSGLPVEAMVPECDDVQVAVEVMDAWHAGHGVLRLRWRRCVGEGAFVVRAFQRNPDQSDVVVLVGEGALRSEFDLFDVLLVNPFFPLLFVVAEADGTFVGASLMAFPSLRRGGAHYAESLLDLDEADLAARLLAVAQGQAQPLVGSIKVDLAGADGAELLFRRELRDWLAMIARIDVEPGKVPIGMSAASADWLAREIALKSQAGRQSGGNVLHLAGDMIPSLSVLAAISAQSDGADGTKQQAQSLLVVPADPALGVRLISMPMGEAALLGPTASNTQAPFPLLSGSADALVALPAAALRRIERLPAEAEMLCPVAAPMLTMKDGSTVEITVVLDPSAWDEAELVRALEALAMQGCADKLVISFAAPAPVAVADVAARLFPARSATFADAAAAFTAAISQFVAWVGPGVILHDDRTLAVLAGLLAPKAVFSAGCVIVTSTKRGKAWQVSAGDTEVLGAADAPLMWRSTVPVKQPPHDLWVARTNAVKAHLRGQGHSDQEFAGYHLYTSLVTASYCTIRREQSDAPLLPGLNSRHALTIKVLVA